MKSKEWKKVEKYKLSVALNVFLLITLMKITEIKQAYISEYKKTLLMIFNK